MFRFFVFINLILVYVYCQTAEVTSTFSSDFDTSQSWQEETTEQSLIESSTNIDRTQSWQGETTEQPLELGTNTDATQSWQEETTEQLLLESSTNIDRTQSWQGETTEQPFELSNNTDATQSWENFTTEGASEESNFTTVTTTQQITSTMTTTTISATCPPSITPDNLEEAKKEIISSVLLAISREITSKLEAIEERLSTLTCSNNNTTPPLELAWQIYENLQISLNGWLRVFEQPYSHKTRTEDLNQIAGICHNQMLVAAMFNKSISLAAVGPTSVLTLNTTWNQPQKVGQVYWYRTNGKSFGFSPLATIRQTPGDNEDLSSPLRLSWLLDQNIGGYRAGAIRSLADNSLWRKVIYCN